MKDLNANFEKNAFDYIDNVKNKILIHIKQLDNLPVVITFCKNKKKIGYVVEHNSNYKDEVVRNYVQSIVEKFVRNYL